MKNKEGDLSNEMEWYKLIHSNSKDWLPDHSEVMNSIAISLEGAYKGSLMVYLIIIILFI